MSTRRSPATGGVRFAPSPTGRFHIGNLRTAWISFQLARHFRLPWIVRFEDIDRPRVLPGAREHQLADLAALGMTPDHLLTQTEFHERHWDGLVSAIRQGQVYPCDCSRKDVQVALAGLASAPHDGISPVYSGHCRAGGRDLNPVESLAWRFRMPDASGKADFIVARSSAILDKSGLPAKDSFVPAYHWACAIDDYDGAYDLIVRGVDLAPAAGLQRELHRWLAKAEIFREPPGVFHTALVTQNDGHRLEKRTRGVTLLELASKGLGASELVTLLAASFTMPASLERNKISAESIAAVTLTELGLPPSI